MSLHIPFDFILVFNVEVILTRSFYVCWQTRHSRKLWQRRKRTIAFVVWQADRVRNVTRSIARNSAWRACAVWEKERSNLKTDRYQLMCFHTTWTDAFVCRFQRAGCFWRCDKSPLFLAGRIRDFCKWCHSDECWRQMFWQHKLKQAIIRCQILESDSS